MDDEELAEDVARALYELRCSLLSDAELPLWIELSEATKAGWLEQGRVAVATIRYRLGGEWADGYWLR